MLSKNHPSLSSPGRRLRGVGLAIGFLGVAGGVYGQTGRGLTEVMGVGVDLGRDGERARVVSEMRLIEDERRDGARREAQRLGLP